MTETSLTPRGRAVRALLTFAVMLATLAGTFWGEDDNFPFGPFRMFSTRNELDGHVNAAEVWGVTEEGRLFELEFEWLGLRRAEVEGQILRFQEDPSALGYLVEAYDHFHPEGPDLTRIELRERRTELVNGEAAGPRRFTLLAAWDVET